jgi:transcriptional regulator with XRE-family HTH domain
MAEPHTVHGDWIRWLYFSRNLRNSHVAAKVGVTSASVRQWMTGAKRPTEEHRHALAQLCGVSPEQYHHGPRTDIHAVVKYVVVQEGG